ncbi:MAG: 4-hydroxy-3-methylbut-2-enyl diphosphate reductase [Candidatus Omnitrophica bacterium]|nr:4-hydroxy-3-methylbut-2-enyl diphosphate reductase [Candidatus Omnitrophota bacterium]
MRKKPNTRLLIRLARSAGFCFGVRRALDMALETARSRRRVFMLGDIVHNEDVAGTMRRAGIAKIRRLRKGRDAVLLVRAHGTPQRILRRALSSGYTIVDATCPMVKHIHAIARRREALGDRIIIIGDKRHDEVIGIIGQLKKKALVLDTCANIPRLKGVRRAAVVVQSTQRIENALTIVKALKKRVTKLVFFNTVCRPTRIKQEEIKRMPTDNDLMLVIGSKTSANTRRLYEISKSLNPRSYWVQSRRDIDPRWFRGVSSVGITAGASTPDETIAEVVSYLKTSR